MKKPVLDFLEYLVLQCVENCEVDPDTTTVTQFLEIIKEAEQPVGA
jgi:hypothetical protein